MSTSSVDCNADVHREPIQLHDLPSGVLQRVAQMANRMSFNVYICPFYMGLGGCQYGLDCHNGGHTASGIINPFKTTAVCRNYQTGTCTYGAGCHFVHQMEGDRYTQYFSPPNNLRLVSKETRLTIDHELTSMTWGRGGEESYENDKSKAKITQLPRSLMSRLTSLRFLNVSHIPNLASLEGIPLSLEELICSDCPGLTSLAPLTVCRNLKGITLGRSGVTSLSPLSSLTKLTHLKSLPVSDALASDFRLGGNGLEGLPASLIEIILSLWPENLITAQGMNWDLSPLSLCLGLKKLDVPHSFFTSLTPLCVLAHLESLNVSDMAKLTSLDGCPPNLKEIVCSNCPLTSLSPLSLCQSLTKILFCADHRMQADFPTEVLDLSPLSALTILEILDLNGRPLTSLLPLLPCLMLKQLTIKGSNIEGLAQLKEARGKGIYLRHFDFPLLDPPYDPHLFQLMQEEVGSEYEYESEYSYEIDSVDI